MVKAQVFWDYLCNELGYRFFSGVACLGLNPLYKKMNSDIMHYVPAVNEKTALGLVSGALMGGFKGGLLMDMSLKNDILTFLKLNIDYNIPFLVIGYSDEKSNSLFYDLPTTYITNDHFKTKIKKITSESERDNIPGIIIIKGDGILA